MQIPENLKEHLIYEDCSNFNIDSYFVTRQSEEVKEAIMKTREKAELIKKVMGKSYPNTTLLYGSAGTGKTTLAKYLSYSLGLPFFYVNFAENLQWYVWQHNQYH